MPRSLSAGYGRSEQKRPCWVYPKLFNPSIRHWKKLNFGRLPLPEFKVCSQILTSYNGPSVSPTLTNEIWKLPSSPSSLGSVSMRSVRSGCLFSLWLFGSVTKSSVTSCHTQYYAVTHASSASRCEERWVKKKCMKAHVMGRRGWNVAQVWEPWGRLDRWEPDQAGRELDPALRGMHVRRNTASVLL